MFWGPATLRYEVRNKRLIFPYCDSRVDGASYRLSIGDEVYISPTGEQRDRVYKPKMRLKHKDGFIIPPGQFALIITEETVKIPLDVLGFVSIRARYKFRGLINVSGFHVDPGYSGKFLFSVFNAGPSEIALARGEECFQLWFAELKDTIKYPRSQTFKEIPSDIIGHVARENISLRSLNEKIDSLERRHAIFANTTAFVVLLMISLAAKILYDAMK